MLRSAMRPLLSGKVDDWHGEYAYSVGLQAFIYGFPYIYNAQIRHKWVTEPRSPTYVPYAAHFEDAEGEKLKADHRYRIRFGADDMPPVDSFWSLAMYGTDLSLAANPIDPYSIGDRTAGLKNDPDGGLTIYRSPSRLAKSRSRTGFRARPRASGS